MHKNKDVKQKYEKIGDEIKIEKRKKCNRKEKKVIQKQRRK